jgi:hypothetical protein
LCGVEALGGEIANATRMLQESLKFVESMR